MKGLLFPKLEVHLSLNAPIRGWTNRPDKGPANQTRAVSSFDRSSDKR